MILSLLLATYLQDLTVIDVLAHARGAVGVTAAPTWKEASLTGKAVYNGVDCQYSMRFQPNGQFVENLRGDLMGGGGFDGKQSWLIDSSGMARRTCGEDAAIEETIASFVTNRWLREGVLEKSFLISQKNGETTLLVKNWESKLFETVTIDSQTWLPKKLSLDTHNGPVQITLANWQSVGSEQIPFHAEINDRGSISTLDVQQGSTSEVLNEGAYAMPTEMPDDWSYDSAIPAQIEAKTVRGHIFVHPLINGKDVGWFILDTCAEIMMIDEHTADSIGLQKFGGAAISGVGGTIIEPFRRASEMTLGPAKVRNIVFNQLDTTGFSKVFGIQVAGIVGGDVLKRFVASVDVEKPAVALYDRRSYQLPTGSWLPLTFLDGNPAVEGTIEGDRRGLFHLDAGSDGSLVIHTPFVNALHLLDNRETKAGATGGFGGQVSTQEGTLEWFTLGGHRFEQVRTTFSKAETGSFANTDVMGNVGQLLMKPFTLIFDFGGYRVAFLPKG
ncbi:MAG: retropepsin-like domain-containing protein [Armatimonadetes bacterium]|nr:retropepsin-like domain-containing protein [Armatimonadota bacterium]